MDRLNPFQAIYDECNKSMSKKALTTGIIFPRCVDIELTNTCNMRCRMCPTGQGQLKRPQGIMDRKVFHAILEQVQEHDCAIRFIRWGEPLLHPMLPSFIKECVERNVKVHINTNGLLMSEHLNELFCEYPLTSIKFSFQGLVGDEYYYWRGVRYFATLIEKMGALHKCRGDREFPYISCGTTIEAETQLAKERFLAKVLPYCDGAYIGITKDLQKVNLSHYTTQCPEVFDKLSIDWDGQVTACCSDYDRKMIVGDATKTRLEDIWKCKQIDFYRFKIASGKFMDLDLCSKCPRPNDDMRSRFHTKVQ